MDESFQPISRSQAPINKSATAFLATGETMAGPNRYANIGAINHVTVDMESLVVGAECHGQEKLMVGKLTIQVSITRVNFLFLQIFITDL